MSAPRDWNARDGFPGAPTQYGFTWGPAEVVRVSDDKKWGVMLRIEGKRGAAMIRVTPGGRVHIYDKEVKP